MKIKKFMGGTLESNGYVIYQEKGGMCYIIDPGYNPKKFISFVRENDLTCNGIILTHLHHDHVGAAKAVQSSLECKTYMHRDDAFVYKEDIDVYLNNNDKLLLEDEELLILHTPGHTKGSICIMSEKSRVCFTGDTIFDTDLGRSDLDGGSETDMEWSIKNVIDKWDNDIIIYPGHDNSCTMKKVRLYNNEFLALREGKNR